MLYYLFQYLEKFDFPGAGMFGYVSFRSLMAIILSLLISAIFGEYFINLLDDRDQTKKQENNPDYFVALEQVFYQIHYLYTLILYYRFLTHSLNCSPRSS